MISDLATWLLAQLKTDEAIAMVPVMAPRDAVKGWRRSTTMPDGTILVVDEDGDYVAQVAPSYALHVAIFDRRRVLAECAAKRAVIEEWFEAADAHLPDHDSHYAGSLTRALVLLALAYADREGWREEWRA